MVRSLNARPTRLLLRELITGPEECDLSSALGLELAKVREARAASRLFADRAEKSNNREKGVPG